MRAQTRSEHKAKPQRENKTEKKPTNQTKKTGVHGAARSSADAGRRTRRAHPAPLPHPAPHTAHTEGYQHQGFSCFFFLRPMTTEHATYAEKIIIIIKKRSADLLPRRAAAPAVAAAQTQAGTKWPPRTSWHGRPRAPSAHRAAAGRGAAHVTGSGLAPSRHACGREPPFCVSLRAGPRVMLGVCGAACVDRCGFCNIHCVFQ